MAELVGDHVVDGVDRRPHEAAVQQQASGRRHGPPSLPGLAYDETSRPECLRIREVAETELDPLRKLDVCPVPVPCLDQFAGHLRPGWPVCLHDDEAADQPHAFLDMRDNLQPVLAPEVEMGLTGDKSALREVRRSPTKNRVPIGATRS